MNTNKKNKNIEKELLNLLGEEVFELEFLEHQLKFVGEKLQNLKNEFSKRKKRTEPKMKRLTQNFKNQKQEILLVLIIYIYDHFGHKLGEKGTVFIDFLKKTEDKSLKDLMLILVSIMRCSSLHENEVLYKKSEMLEFSMTDDEAIAEFDRVTDTLRLDNDPLFCYYIEEQIENNNLSVHRKENLQKLLNMNSCLNDNEMMIMRLVNTYS